MDLYKRRTTKSLLRGVAQAYSNAVGSASLEWDGISEAWWGYAYTRQNENGVGTVIWSERYASIKQARVDFDIAISVLMDHLSEAKELSDDRQ